MTEMEAQEVLDWMRTRPRSIQHVMTAIPPAALVRSRADVQLQCPAPDEVGQVLGYDILPTGEPYVMVAGAEDMVGYCRPEWLELVAVKDYIDGDFVRAVCGLEA